MACIIVPAAEAVMVTAVAFVLKANEKKVAPATHQSNHNSESCEHSISFSKKLMWLANLLWGGVFLLAFEHLWHGEIVPWFPFLTAASDPAETALMLEEMRTVGTMMAVELTTVWLVMLAIVKHIVGKKCQCAAV